MKPRTFLFIVVSAACVTAWWQVESRLKTARDLHTRLAEEAAHHIESAEPHPLGPNSSLPPDPFTIRW